MNHTEIINKLIEKYNFKSYLEIGVSDPNNNFNHIICNRKISVDPRTDYSGYTFCMTSDKFFEINQEKFDIIFIDGLHEFTQNYRDITNSLNILNEGGIVVCHDMSPSDEKMQITPAVQGLWCGDVWKSWILLRQLRSDLTMKVIDTDYGVGLISKGNQKQLPFNLVVNYENFDKNRKEWLNLIAVDGFCRDEFPASVSIPFITLPGWSSIN